MQQIGVRLTASTIAALERAGPTVAEAARKILERWAKRPR